MKDKITVGDLIALLSAYPADLPLLVGDYYYDDFQSIEPCRSLEYFVGLSENMSKEYIKPDQPTGVVIDFSTALFYKEEAP